MRHATKHPTSWNPPYGTNHEPIFDLATATAEACIDELSRLASDRSLADARALADACRQRFPQDDRFERWVAVLRPPRVVGPAVGQTTGEQVRAWLTAHGAQYVGCWVVLDRDQLVGAGSTLDELREVVGRSPSAVALEVTEELVRG